MATRRKLSTVRKSTRRKKDFKIELESTVAREVGAMVYLGVAAISFLVISGRAGLLGNFLNDYLRLALGVGAYVLPGLFFALGATLFFSHRVRFDAARYLGITLLVFSGLGLFHMRTPIESMLDSVQDFGGYAGFLSSVLLRIFISDIGAKVVLSVAFVISVLITFEISIKKIVSLFIPDRSIKMATRASSSKRAKLNQEEELNIVKPNITPEKEPEEIAKKPEPITPTPVKVTVNKPEAVQPTVVEKPREVDYSDWELPSLDLLNNAKSQVFVTDKILNPSV